MEFKPFGHANWTDNGDGGLEFNCQHGKDECLGNMAQVTFIPQEPEVVHNFTHG